MIRLRTVGVVRAQARPPDGVRRAIALSDVETERCDP
jgi:hypothetical protein